MSAYNKRSAGRSENMMLKTAEELAVLNPDAVKYSFCTY